MPNPITVDAERHIAGFAIRTRNADEMNPKTAQIGALWQRFMTSGLAGMPVGVYTDYESDQNGAYTLVAGVDVGAGAELGDGQRRAIIQPGSYLVFEGRGELPAVVIRTWSEVWSYFTPGALQARAFRTDFEEYPEEGVVRIHIGVLGP
jgi:predicted transcriptional regulator YdeE